jgi:hypothetical protein
MFDLTTDEYYNDTLIWGAAEDFDYPDNWLDEPEGLEDEITEDEWYHMQEDALMEYHLGLDC